MIGCVALVVISAFGYIDMNRGFFTFIAILFVISMALSMSLVWAKRLTEERLKVLSIVFLSIICVCALCWIVSIVMINNIVGNLVEKDVTESKLRSLLGMFAFIKFTLIFTVQVFIASQIAGNVSKFGKEKITLQVINAIGFIIMDIVITTLLSIITIRENAASMMDTIRISKGAINILKSKFLWMLFVLSIFTTSITNGITQSLFKRIQRSMAEKEMYGKNKDYEIEKKYLESQNETIDESNEIENKLNKLKEMFDKNMITKEEYDQKRKDLIDKI